MKTIRYALLSAISLGAAVIPSIAHAQSNNRGEWRGHGRTAPAVVVAPPVVTPPVAVALPPVPVPVVAPRVTLRANIGPNAAYAHGPRFGYRPGFAANGDGLGNAREVQQEQQIRIASMRGQLTPREYNRLMQGQAQIDAMQSQAASDGVVTPFESRGIQRAQDFQAREIARFESNRRGGFGR